MKTRYIIILTLIIILVIPIFIFSKIDRVINLPKYQQKLWGSAYNIFMDMPDIIKSSIMIISGKRNFSNLFNDYNVKFLPETQYLKLDFNKKKIEFQKSVRHTFFIDYYKDSIFIFNKNGKIFKSEIKNLNNKNSKLDIEEVKHKNLILDDETKFSIKDALVINNKIYLSKVATKNNCKKLSIVFTEIQKDLVFNTLKEFDECALHQIGAGRIEKYIFNSKEGILLTTTDSDNDVPGSKAQNDNSIFGKVIFINLNNGNYNIFSKGHRNAQGLAVKNNIIISTEHGPRGGDEINRIIYGENYGWPIASYGYSYEKKELVYKKSHEQNLFKEPLYVFLPSIGISQLILFSSEFDERWNDNAIVTSLNGRSIYRVKFQNGNFDKVLYSEKIYIGERIRDIIYVEENNLIVLALERTGSIGILKKLN